MKKIISFLFIMMLNLLPLFINAEILTISQIDNTPLLINQQIKVYVSATDENGYPKNDLNEDQFKIYEQEKEND